MMKISPILTPDCLEILLNGFSESGNPSRRLVDAVASIGEGEHTSSPSFVLRPALSKLHIPIYRRSGVRISQEQPIEVDLPEDIFREVDSVARMRGVEFDRLFNAAIAHWYTKTVIVRLLPKANEELRRLSCGSQSLSRCVANLVYEPMPSFVWPAGYRRGLNPALQLCELVSISRGRYSGNPGLIATTILMRKDLYVALSGIAMGRKSSVNVLVNTAILLGKTGAF